MKPLQFVGQAAQFKFESKFEPLPVILTLAELHVHVLTSFIRFNKALTNFMKLLPNHIMV